MLSSRNRLYAVLGRQRRIAISCLRMSGVEINRFIHRRARHHRLTAGGLYDVTVKYESGRGDISVFNVYRSSMYISGS